MDYPIPVYSGQSESSWLPLPVDAPKVRYRSFNSSSAIGLMAGARTIPSKASFRRSMSRCSASFLLEVLQDSNRWVPTASRNVIH